MIKQHMLFVEDIKDMREGVVLELRGEFPDYKVEGVSTIKGAKSALRKGKNLELITRVVIVDECLTDGSGSDLLGYIHKMYPGIKKIMLAAQATPATLSRAINFGSLDKYILKTDFTHNHQLLFDAIRDSLEDSKDFIFNAITQVLMNAQQEGAEEEAILVSGKTHLTPAELLQQVTMQTELGQKHMKQFSELIYSVFLKPEDFLTALEKRAHSEKSSKRKKVKKCVKKKRTRRPSS